MCTLKLILPCFNFDKINFCAVPNKPIFIPIDVLDPLQIAWRLLGSGSDRSCVQPLSPVMPLENLVY